MNLKKRVVSLQVVVLVASLGGLGCEISNDPESPAAAEGGDVGKADSAFPDSVVHDIDFAALHQAAIAGYLEDADAINAQDEFLRLNPASAEFMSRLSSPEAVVIAGSQAEFRPHEFRVLVLQSHEAGVRLNRVPYGRAPVLGAVIEVHASRFGGEFFGRIVSVRLLETDAIDVVTQTLLAQ